MPVSQEILYLIDVHIIEYNGIIEKINEPYLCLNKYDTLILYMENSSLVLQNHCIYADKTKYKAMK